uniref:hypothetical protein ycf35 n=1 Tax=Nemalion vermiculare TaxID=935621 RepID=UPI00257A9101|nr:hypothetical protein ycf35 [Nemalion vermiculare]WGV34427.1 hypothetical protein ycf35 [Nemalion vermiculare]
MSHLSKIKTKITSHQRLAKVLHNLQIDHTVYDDDNSQPAFSLREPEEYTQNSYLTVFTWDGDSYQIIADSSTWQEKHMLEAMADKVYQTYAYQTVLEEGYKQGFKNVDNYSRNDGSLRLVLEKWRD